MSGSETARARLEARLAELEQRLANIERDLDEPVAKNPDEQAIQVEDDESLEGQARLATNEMAAIKAALERIAEGSYGTCMQCGEPIAPPRLEARPEAALCIECATAR